MNLLHPAALLQLAALLAAPLPDEPGARARALVKTCEQVRLKTGVGFKCPGALVQLTSSPGDDEQAALDEQIAGVRAAYQAVAVVDPAKFKVAGRDRPGARFRIDPAAKIAPGALGLIVAYAPGGGMVRAVSCVMPEPEPSMTGRCEAILDGLGAVGPGFFAGAETDRAPPMFLDRKLTLPRDCQPASSTPDGFQIACGSKASLAYVKQEDEARARKALAFLRDAALKSGDSDEGQPRPCTIGGVAATCEVVFSRAGVIRMGVATVQGQAVVVSCTQEATRKGVHPLCAQVMKF